MDQSIRIIFNLVLCFLFPLFKRGEVDIWIWIIFSVFAYFATYVFAQMALRNLYNLFSSLFEKRLSDDTDDAQAERFYNQLKHSAHTVFILCCFIIFVIFSLR